MLFLSNIQVAHATIDESIIEATAAYWGAAILVERLGHSECNYVFNKPFSSRQTLKNIVSNLTKKERSIILPLLKSKDESMKRDADNMIQGLLSSIKKGGMDGRTACGIASTFLIEQLRTWETKWRNALQTRRH